MSEPGQIRFPAARGSGGSVPTLSLRRRPVGSRSPFAVSEVSAAARESIKAVMSATRAPFAGAPSTQAAELERTLRQLELSLAEREHLIAEGEARLADRERDVAESEALLAAREKLVAASRKATAGPISVSPEEKAALEQLRSELEKQEAGLKEAKQAQREREQFLDESEAKLFEKVQAQQEKEIELEQRAEDLAAREQRSGIVPPAGIA